MAASPSTGRWMQVKTISAEGDAEAAPARGVPWRAGLAAAGTSVMFGFVPLAARGLYADGLSTWSLLCWRYLLALVIIFAGIRLTRLRLGAALRQGAWRIALVGVSLGAVQTLCYFQSLRWLDTGTAVLLFYTFPVVTLGVERFFFKQQVAPAALLCVIVIFAGAALIAVPGLRNGTIDPRGLAWAIPGPVIYAFCLAANARLMACHPAPSPQCRNPTACRGWVRRPMRSPIASWSRSSWSAPPRSARS